jgi:hypothetical protein
MSHWSLGASPPLFPHLSNFECTLLGQHPDQLPANTFSMIEINQLQHIPEWHEIICDPCQPVQGPILNLFQIVLPTDIGPMLLLQKHPHQSFLPLVECTLIGLPKPCGKLLQCEFELIQANWGSAFSTD